MALLPIDEVLHDLLDDLETIGEEVRIALATFIAGLDPVRLGDPDDVAYNAEVIREIARILQRPIEEAHALGRRAARLLTGSTAAPTAAPILEEHLAVIAAEVQDGMASLGRNLDRYLTQAQRRGLSPRTALDTIERALQAAVPGSGVAPPRGLSFVADVQAFYTDVVSESVGGASRAGQMEQYALDLGPSQGQDLVRDAATLPMTWICALVNTCPDCLPRHGTTRPLNEWIGRGLPQTGWSVCGTHCMCQTVAAEVAAERIDPLRRVKTTQRGLTVRTPGDLLSSEPDLELRRRRRDQRLAEAYADSLEVRRAFRELGRANAGGAP